MAWQLPENEDRCPGCGRFVSMMNGFCDVLPGGCRGVDENGYYCGAPCADETYAKEHAALKDYGPCQCED